MERSNLAYIGLIRELAITSFKLKYQGSILGYLWSLVKPLAIFAVLYVVFTKFIRLGGDIEHYPIYLLIGVVLWTYFADSTLSTMSAIVDRSDLIRKVYFPRIVIVIAASISSFITLLLNLVVILIFLLATRIPFHLDAVLFFLLVAELFLLSLGVSLLLSALYVKFRDFRHIWELALQILFYATPVIYPLNIIPHKIAAIAALSPVTQILQDSRYLLVTRTALRGATLDPFPWVLIPYLLPLVILAIGYAVFTAASAQFAEEV